MLLMHQFILTRVRTHAFNALIYPYTSAYACFLRINLYLHDCIRIILMHCEPTGVVMQ